MKVKFWGVRGSIATPGEDTIIYGGNTPCVEIRPDDKTLLIIDAGTGLRNLGKSLLKENFGRGEGSTHILFSHTHWDHVQGLPFFIPAYITRDGHTNKIALYGRDNSGQTIEEILKEQMKPIFFPVPLGGMGAEFSFNSLVSGKSITINNSVITPLLINHPEGSLSFRVEFNNKAIVYCSDYEHPVDNSPEESLVEHCRDADLLIYDSMYTEKEYTHKRGFGHSTLEHGILLAKKAGVKQFCLFHYEPEHSDAFIRKMEVQAIKKFSNSIAAKEGLQITF